MSDCQGTLLIGTLGGFFMCCLDEGHLGDHVDDVLKVRWPVGVTIGTCHLPPRGGIEVVQ